MEEEQMQLDHEKAARREARSLKEKAAVQHKTFLDARRMAWEAVKAEYEEMLEKWELGG